MVMSNTLSIKIRQAYLQLPDGLNFLADTPKVRRAEDELNKAMTAWHKDPNVALEDVRGKWREFVDAVKTASEV